MIASHKGGATGTLWSSTSTRRISVCWHLEQRRRTYLSLAIGRGQILSEGEDLGCHVVQVDAFLLARLFLRDKFNYDRRNYWF